MGFQKGNKTKSQFRKGHIQIVGAGFQKGHKDFVPKKSRIMVGKRMKEKGIKPPSAKGLKRSNKTRIKISESKGGKKAWNYKGGITLKNEKIRKSIEFRLWRESVFARDNWTCQKYGIKGGKLHPHHIQNFSQFPELRFAIDNGITLSEKAHKDFHKTYGNKNNTKEQIKEFINYNGHSSSYEFKNMKIKKFKPDKVSKPIKVKFYTKEGEKIAFKSGQKVSKPIKVDFYSK